MKFKYVLSDLDGVIRKYPESRNQFIESKFGLAPGTLHSAAFKNPLLEEVVCGRISDETWRFDIATKVSKEYSEAVAVQAVQEWSDFPGQLDESYLEFLKEYFPGLPIVVLTNGTTRLNSDLAKLGIRDRFFKIFNSAEIGFCKPNPKIFEHVLQQLNCLPSEILFVDDSLSHVQAAQELGFHIHHYTSIEKLSESVALQVYSS